MPRYKFLKPAVTNITDKVGRRASGQWQFKAISVVALILGVALFRLVHDVRVFILTVVIIMTYLARVAEGVRKDLEKEFTNVLELEDLLEEKLDKIKFTPIGDLPYIL